MPVFKNDATSEQKANYLESLVKAKNAIDEAIGNLRAIKAVTGLQDEVNTINVELLDLRGDSEKLQARILAFVSTNASFEPPSEATVNAIKEKAAMIDSISAQAGQSGAIIDLATEVLNQARSMFG